MLTAVFKEGFNTVTVPGLWKWDYGQRLQIEGLDLPAAVQIHFATHEKTGSAITRIGTTEDGVTTVAIPNALLTDEYCSCEQRIYAFIYPADEDEGETVKTVILPVRPRPEPEDFDLEDDPDLFGDVIEQVNAAADAAASAERAAGEQAAAAESQSEHPLAQAIVEAARNSNLNIPNT